MFYIWDAFNTLWMKKSFFAVVFVFYAYVSDRRDVNNKKMHHIGLLKGGRW